MCQKPRKSRVYLVASLMTCPNGLLVRTAYHAPDLIFDAWSSPCQAVAQDAKSLRQERDLS